MHANRKPGNTRPPRTSAASSLPSIPSRITEDDALRPSQHSPPRPVRTAGGETANCLRFGSKHLPSLPACADQRPVKQPCAGPASSDLSTAALHCSHASICRAGVAIFFSGNRASHHFRTGPPPGAGFFTTGTVSEEVGRGTSNADEQHAGSGNFRHDGTYTARPVGDALRAGKSHAEWVEARRTPHRCRGVRFGRESQQATGSVPMPAQQDQPDESGQRRGAFFVDDALEQSRILRTCPTFCRFPADDGHARILLHTSGLPTWVWAALRLCWRL